MENHKNDILKNFLQDTFSDYEPEPSEASWENIFSAIQPNKPTFWDKSKPWIASVLVVLTGVWLWYGSTRVEANHVEIALNTHETAGVLDTKEGKIRPQITHNRIEILPIFTDKIDKNQRESVKSFTPLLVFSPTKSASDLLVKTPTKAGIVSGRVETLATDANTESKNEGKITKYSKEIIVKSNTPKEGGENHPTVEIQSDEAVVSTNDLTASASERVEKTNKSGLEGTLATDITDKSGQLKTLDTDITDKSGQLKTLDTDMDGTENSIIEQVRYIRPLESLRNKDFTLAKIALNSPMITSIITPNREAKPVRQHTYLSMSITPIQTYRILTINNHSIQNVQTNNLFDSERNGWAFDLGVIKPISKLWNFRANLSYLRMRQWSEYQIGTDELILRNNNYGSNNSNPQQGASSELEVVGQTVTESKNLHMVGLKIDVQKFFKITAKNRYFISTGTQVMYENSQKQSNIFLNVSAGFQHIVSKTTFLTIEPTASYSLNNFNDSRSLLQANGYNLGLKMGVSFRVK